MKNKKKPIVISHASKDKALADKLSDLLTNGCAVDPNDILCTSLEGKGIPAGTTSFIQYLKEQFQEPDLVILLLTENFFASLFCLCELGAVWALELPNFPLVVPPMDKGHLKATLAVAQAGDINNASYLDELRDRIKETVGTEVATATWNVKRDTFLQALDAVLKTLEKPTNVPVEKLKEAQAQYQAALTEIGQRDQEVQKLKNQVIDLEKCKDAAQVRAIARKYSTAEEQFERLCQEAQTELGQLERATCIALFQRGRGDYYFPQGQDQWDDVHAAEEVQEVVVPQHENYCEPNAEHPRVRDAVKALRDLERFLDDTQDPDFLERFEEEHKYPASMGNKDFWKEFLRNV